MIDSPIDNVQPKPQPNTEPAAETAKHLKEKMSVKQLSSLFAVAVATSTGGGIRATGDTPVEYAQRVKSKAAKKSLKGAVRQLAR